MLTLSVIFLVSFVVTLMMIRYSSLHAHTTVDWDLDDAQKFHVRPIPRVGGLKIMLALAAAAVAAWIRDPKLVGYPLLLLVLCVMPIFVTGFIEDMTKRTNPRRRLFAIMVAALTAVYFLDAKIIWIDVHLTDMALTFPIISIMITAIAMTGLANSISIIDDFSGLASMVAIMILVSLAYATFHVGDTLILTIAFAMIGAIPGFLIWNSPAGHIFLGGGGVYMIGFVLAEYSILLVLRNVSVSAWYPALMVIYPIFETLFSIYRRQVLKGVLVGYPDGVHLHTLVYQCVIRQAVGNRDERHRLQRNSLISSYLQFLSLLTMSLATLFWNNELALLGFVVVSIFFYVWLYWRVVRFQSPRWLIVKRHHRVKKHHKH